MDNEDSPPSGRDVTMESWSPAELKSVKHWITWGEEIGVYDTTLPLDVQLNH